MKTNKFLSALATIGAAAGLTFVPTTSAQSPSASQQDQALNPNAEWYGLHFNDFSWQRGKMFTDLCTGRVTFHNSGTEAIGNIHYRTYYISETGIRHENSIIDAVIEKLIQPGETRTIELEKFLVPNDSNQAGIYFISCDRLPQFTKQAENKESGGITSGDVQIRVYHDAKSWRRDHPPTQEEIDAEKKLQAAWDHLTPIQRKNLRADELAWIKAKDNTVMGFDRIRMIKDRTEVLTNLGERFSK